MFGMKILPDGLRQPEIIQENSLGLLLALDHTLDDQVGELIATLKANGLYENTIQSVYAADNGLAIGRNGLLGKAKLVQHSTKVPISITDRAIPKGSTFRCIGLFGLICTTTLADLAD